MIRASLLLLSGLLLTTSTAYADAHAEDVADTSARSSWTLTVDPLTTAIGYVHIQVEHALSPRLSLYVGPSLRLFNGILSEDDDDYTGYGVEAGVRWFFFGTAPSGWWAGVRGVAALIQTDASGETERALGGYGSALAGYTWQPNNWLVLSGGAGIQYIHYKVEEQGTDGLLPALHTAVGVAF